MNILLSMLTVLFVGLKLTGHVTWPWLLVFAPVWVPLAVIGIIGFISLALVYYGNKR